MALPDYFAEDAFSAEPILFGPTTAATDFNGPSPSYKVEEGGGQEEPFRILHGHLALSGKIQEFKLELEKSLILFLCLAFLGGQ